MNITTPTPLCEPRCRAFTLIELMAVTAIIAVLSAVAFPGIKAAMRGAQMNAALQNARQIATGLRAYAADNEGAYPLAFDPDTDEEYSNSNEVFRQLIPDYLDTERVFSVAQSVWGPRADGRIDEEEERLEEGENHWAYIAGLTDTSRSDWPLVVDGTDGSGKYSSEPNTKGGTWEGRKAIVVRVGGSAETVKLRGEKETRYLPRYGYPEEDALELEAYMGEVAKLLDPAG